MVYRGTVYASVFLILVIVTIAAPLNAVLFVFPPAVYDIDKAYAEINKAQSTSDLRLVKVYVGNALEDLSGYSGNPSWWYPTVQTDWGRIKEALRSVVDQIDGMTEPETSYAYQQLVDNINFHQLPEIQEQLRSCATVMTEGSMSSVAWIIGIIAAWVIFFITVYVWEE